MAFTNPGSAVGTNAAYRGRTSVNAFNDILAMFSRGILNGWACAPAGGLTVNIGGSPLIRDVAIAENDLGQRTTVNNISNQPIPVTLDEAPTLGSRIDVIVAFVNNPPDMPIVTPIPVDSPDVCGLIVVKGNVSNNPVVPDETMIRAAITADGAAGTTAYYVVLGAVLVPAGIDTITAQMITQGSTATYGSANIADGSIINQKLADGSVTGSKIADGTVTSDNIDWVTISPVAFALVEKDVFESGAAPSVKYQRFGGIVQVRFDEFRFKEAYPHSTRLASGLPRALDNDVILYLSSVNASAAAIPSMRVKITVNGEVLVHYSSMTPGLVYGGTFMYFSA